MFKWFIVHGNFKEFAFWLVVHTIRDPPKSGVVQLKLLIILHWIRLCDIYVCICMSAFASKVFIWR